MPKKYTRKSSESIKLSKLLVHCCVDKIFPLAREKVNGMVA
jgi:hypothetical protein